MSISIRSVLALALGALAPCLMASAGEGLGPVSMAASSDGLRLYVGQAASESVVAFDVATTQVVRKLRLDGPPAGLALAKDGQTLYVTEANPRGRVVIVDTVKMKEKGELPAGHTPTWVALSPDGTRAAICNRFDNDVTIIDLSKKSVTARAKVLREPVCAVWSTDGARLFVGNHLPVGPANGAYISSAISVIDTASGTVVTNIALPNGSTALRELCLSPDGRYLYTTHLLGHYQLPTTQLERGWMYVNALSVLDAQAPAFVNTVLLDDVDLGAANPWGIACSPDGAWLCVAHAGTHEVSIIDRNALHDRLARAAKGERINEVTSSAADVPTDLSFLYAVRRRVALAGNGPRGIAIGGGRVFATEHFTDSVGAADLTNGTRAVSLPLGDPPRYSQARRGEMLFNDATRCFQHWQSCVSCHPDSRADALNWDLLNDGIGNPKNVKNMLLVHRTPPAMSLGVRESAEAAVRAGFKFIQFAVVPEEETLAVDAYLKTMKAVPSPHLVKGRLSSAAERGRDLYEKAKCGVCHPSPLRTDLKEYDVGTGTGLDEGETFDTPSIIEVWRTAPYLHDGRAATIEEVLTKFNPQNKHGETGNLTQEQLHDLAQYVLSL